MLPVFEILNIEGKKTPFSKKCEYLGKKWTLFFKIADMQTSQKTTLSP